MKKTLSILALVVMSVGLFSCEAETNVEETNALMAEIGDQDSSTGNSSQDDDRQ
ncbi:hypothetical protein SAMN04488116_0580 [Flagellimonas flava]|uniref:Secreted protein n=2 Tax=Flagellimonas flava TaxID=570519 RepID=A0A1M5IAH3_9FLAO|nr:hypothetical protein SAMN04488116_0580 [Allomuricauda flava]